MTILVTGGAGFIGANFVQDWLSRSDETVVNLDKLTYAGNFQNLKSLAGDPRHIFVKGDVCDSVLLGELFTRHQPRAVIHFAAESHVDRSITDPEVFVQTNIVGTFRLLEASRAYWQTLQLKSKEKFRVLHVSTDEVYGSLAADAAPFRESSPYEPNSPYSASKASSDHFVRAYHQTYGLPTLTTNCSNNYGPYQFPEKLIPLLIKNALQLKPLPIYGDGTNVRDWLFVADHCDAIRTVLARGVPGQTYNIGGGTEKTNKDVAHAICALLDELRPRADGHHYRQLITFVRDRPGHDKRYAIDFDKIRRELSWNPAESFNSGLGKTVDWYMQQQSLFSGSSHDEPAPRVISESWQRGTG